MDNKIKIHYIVAIWVLFLPFLILTLETPTPNYRNVFFSSDIYIVNNILEYGHVTAGELNTVKSVEPTRYWGGIFGKLNLPNLQIYYAVFMMVLGVPAHFLNSGFPSSILIYLMFFIIIRRIAPGSGLAISMAGLGAIAPLSSIAHFMNLSYLNHVMRLLVIFLLIVMVCNINKRRVMREITLIALTMTYMFYRYPTLFGIAYLVIVITTVYTLVSNNRIEPFALLIIMGALLTKQVFEIPLVSFQYYFISAIRNLIELNITLPTSGSTQSAPTAIGISYFGLVPTISLLPFGIIGGLIILKKSIENFHTRKNNQFMILSIWGFSILAMSVLYFSTSTTWLISRPHAWSLPLVIISSSVALKSLHAKKFFMLYLIIAGAFIGAFYYHAQDSRTKIQTNQDGIWEGSVWISNNDPGMTIGDTKTGSNVVVNRYYQFKYPKNYQQLSHIYYSVSRDKFICEMTGADAQNLILLEEMRKYGIYAAQSSHQPISNEAYIMRVTTNSHIYANGELSTIKINKHSVDNACMLD